MCIHPSFIYLDRGPNVERVPVPCKKCWRCNQNRVNDYVARSLCEAAYSDWTVTLTLTYADREDLAERVLTPKHFQNFIRSLRDAHHRVRYLVTGEYGDLKGRTHFHCVLFGKGKPLSVSAFRGCSEPLPQRKLFNWSPHWPHGFVFADHGSDERKVRYVAKYLLKTEDSQQRWFSVSKKPPLGAGFFRDKAAEAIALGVVPSSFEYLPPGGDRGRPYLMTGASRRDYLAEVIAGFQERHPGKLLRLSEWVAKSLDKYEWQAFKDKHAAMLDGMTVSELVEAMQENFDLSRMSESEASWQSYKASEYYREDEARHWDTLGYNITAIHLRECVVWLENHGLDAGEFGRVAKMLNERRQGRR